MPKYSFTCSKCGFTEQKFTNSSIKSIDCKQCSSKMKRKLPKILGNPEVTEVVDKYTRTVLHPNHKDNVEDRKKHHYWKHEVPRLVNSGIYELETMLNNQWVYFDEREELQIRTTPPDKA